MQLKQPPLVSVIIPTYKRSHLINRAIDSVLNQTYNNIEIIVVDDNDNDQYRLTTKKNISKYVDLPNFKYIEHSHNKGGSEARNTGIKNAKGKYITFLDDDDYYLKNRVETMIKVINKNKKYDAVISSMFREDINGNKIKTENNFCKGKNYKDFVLNGNIYTGMILIKTEFIKNINGFDSIPRFQDKLFMLKFYDNNGIAQLLKEQLHVMLEHHDERITSKSAKLGRISHKKILKRILQRKNLFSKSELKRIYFKYYYGLASVSASGSFFDRLLCIKYSLISLLYFNKISTHRFYKLYGRCFIASRLQNYLKKRLT